MLELDFLPPWYRRTRRHRRLVVVQGWATVILGFGLSCWMAAVHRNIEAARASFSSVENQLSQSKTQLQEISALSDRRKQWLAQEQMMSKLGLHVETARLIRALDAAMPREVALIGLEANTEERAVDAAPGKPGTPAHEPQTDRRLVVKLQGVAPSDVHLANFMTQLGAVPFFEHVAIGYAKETTENGRIMRAFEVSFSMNLNTPMGQ